MTKDEFIKKFKDILQYEKDDLNLNTNLLDIEEWDSLSIISTVAFLDSEFGKKVAASDLEDIDTIEDLVKLAGI